jgi:hypothetical protein
MRLTNTLHQVSEERMPWFVRIILALGLSLPPPAYSKAPIDTNQLATRLFQFNQHAKYPVPTLDSDQLKRLAEGKIVKIREKPNRPSAPQRVLGFMVVDEPRAKSWLAARDPHFSSLDSFTEVPLTPADHQQVLWYQYFDVPRPFADRHWLITVEDNYDLAIKTDGIAWEHPWDLTPDGPALATQAVSEGRVPGITKHMVNKAIYVTVNQGAWIAIKLPEDRTLLGFHATSVIGGRIPDRFVADYAMWSLGSALSRVAARATTVYEHYDSSHRRVHGGDGVPLPTP